MQDRGGTEQGAVDEMDRGELLGRFLHPSLDDQWAQGPWLAKALPCSISLAVGIGFLPLGHLDSTSPVGSRLVVTVGHRF